jgi:hypothetical protein
MDASDQLVRLITILGEIVADPSFWIGLTTVLMFSLARFNERQRDEEEIDPPIPARAFTTRFRYQLAALTYAGCYALGYGALIILGSFPFSQDILIGLIGAIKDQKIGSPAWAAMAVTTILPFLGPFQRLDSALRVRLQDFASIPLKARRLANEIVVGVRTSHNNVPDSEFYAVLIDCIARLKGSPRLSAQRAYIRFFGSYQYVLDNLAQLAGGPPVGNGKQIADLPHGQWEKIFKRLSRLIACAVLNVESDEFDAREVLVRELTIPGIEPSNWRFTNSQIGLGVIIVIVCVVTGIVGASTYRLGTYRGTVLTIGLVMTTAQKATLIGVLAIPMFILPLLFAAGVQMYLLDRRGQGDPLEWHERLLARVFTFGGSFSLSFLPALAIAAIGARGGTVMILRWLPWAIPPAAVATLFVVQSMWRLTEIGWLNAVVDFLTHATTALLTTWVALNLSKAAGIEPEAFFGLPADTFDFVAEVTAVVTGGTLGALQCGVSRRIVIG